MIGLSIDVFENCLSIPVNWYTQSGVFLHLLSEAILWPTGVPVYPSYLTSVISNLNSKYKWSCLVDFSGILGGGSPHSVIAGEPGSRPLWRVPINWS